MMITYFEKVIAQGENSDANIGKEKSKVGPLKSALKLKAFSERYAESL